MVGVVEGFRWALFGKTAPDVSMFLISISITLVMLITGLYYFKRMEKTFADII
jgi:lipopolysaccharide transport system permease protein